MKETFLEKIYVKNFRNLNESTIEFSKDINCIFGKNGNGKTNILEAIFFFIYGKSFRKNSRFPQITAFDSEKSEIIIKSIIEKGEQKDSYALKVSEEGSEFYQNNKKAKRNSTQLQAIIINPFDSFLFHQTPSQRRTWLNHIISSIDEKYKSSLANFNKALKMRNSLLSKYQGARENLFLQIRALDGQLSKYGGYIVNKREEICIELELLAKDVFTQIFNYPHNFQLKYVSGLKGFSEAEIFEFYQKNLDQDLIFRTTKRGLHRDDIELFLDENRTTDYGSVGQQKVSYLSLLFSYVEYLEHRMKISPILLIDDISGELDSVCWKNLLNYLETKKLQVLITTANDALKTELCKIKNSRNFFVSGGEIKGFEQ
ncbi:MAG: DNA replication and repair protein RecF [Halobacteriovoraceae bacterium]|nr:DNA replication and repair protein RecF [Halobacteriovoraceae bacterium]